MTTHTYCEPALYRENLPPHHTNRADIPTALTALLPGMFELHLQTMNLHRHTSGSHFGNYLLLDDQATQILAATDLIAERVRELGGPTITFIGHIGRLQHIDCNDADEAAPRDMLAKLLKNNRVLAAQMAKTHTLCDDRGDVASASLLENWINEAEGRAWFLHDAERPG
jgi:starvation-inducible DNA-binding protein